ESGRQLLARFPDHLPTLEALAKLHSDRGQFEKAAELLEQAYEANPLKSELRHQLGQTRRLLGNQWAIRGKLPRARSEFESAIALCDPDNRFMTLGAWAAFEFKAGDTAKAEALLTQAATIESLSGSLNAHLLALATAWKLPKAVRSRFDTAFKQQL